MNECTEPECTAPAYARGRCAHHYGRARRLGVERDPAPLPPPVRVARPGAACSEPDCSRAAVGRGRCMRHYAQGKKLGLLDDPSPLPPPARRGEANRRRVRAGEPATSVTIRLAPAELARVEAEQREGESRSDTVRRMISQFKEPTR